MRLLFIINPIAGRGAGLRTWKRLERLVAGRNGFDAVIPASYEETRKTAADAVRAGIHRVVVLGGDGTLDAVAGELTHSDTALGLIPSGTGNDFAKNYGLPKAPEAALETALQSPVKRIDIGLAEGARRHFLNVAGAGFDAEVGRVVLNYPKGLGGTLPYLMGAITTIFRYKAVPVTVDVDGQQYTGPITLAAVANGPQYGGGMRIAPTALRDDGLFDVYLAGELSRGQLLGLLPQVYTGAHVKHPSVTMFRGRRVTITPHAPLYAHVDGDQIPTDNLTFRVEPGALGVAVP